MIVGTAGHVDHGKTALVRALTGIDTDRIPEEKRRGITLELGFAHLALPGGGTVGVIDVPGHERFVKAMAAGAGGIDVALLVVAADEGVMPQTREHVDICTLLGVRRGVLVVTKADLLPGLGEGWLELLEADVRGLVAGTVFEGATLLPVSAKSGEGLDALKAEIARLVTELEAQVDPARGPDAPLFLPIDRAFSSKGFGLVVTGTLQAGRLSTEEAVALLPDHPGPLRVRGLQVHGAAVTQALPGTRVAVNLPELSVDQVRRGLVLTRAGQLPAVRVLDVELSLLPSVDMVVRGERRARATASPHAPTSAASRGAPGSTSGARASSASGSAGALASTSGAPGSSSGARGSTSVAPGSTSSALGSAAGALASTSSALGSTSDALGSTAGAPASAAGAPVSSAGASGSSAGAPGSTSGALGSTSGAPGSSAGAPGSSAGAPGSTSGASGSTSGAPGSSAGASGSSAGASRNTSRAGSGTSPALASTSSFALAGHPSPRPSPPRGEREVVGVGVGVVGLGRRTRQLVTLGTEQVEAIVRLVDVDVLRPGERCFAQLRFARPVAALPGQRFILRGTRAVEGRGATIAGGKVLVLNPPRRRAGAAEKLQRFTESPLDERVRWLIAEAGYAGLDEVSLLARAQATPKDVTRALERASARGGVVLIDRDARRYVGGELLKALEARALARLDAFHVAHPERAGMPREELRQRLGEPPDRVFARVLQPLLDAKRVELVSELLRLPGRGRAFTEAAAAHKQQLLAALVTKALTPPTLTELASALRVGEPRVIELGQALVADGLAVRAGELFFAKASIDALHERLVAHFATHEKLSTQAFKELTGLSRKFLIPLAEYFDREKITLRVGDDRVLRRR